MPDKPFKKFERTTAALFGGRRYPANMGNRVDFTSDLVIGQCKLVQRISGAEISDLAEEMARVALPRHKLGVVCFKIRKGTGRTSPTIIAMTAAVWEQMTGKRVEQLEVTVDEW